jgi:hypothetical protein
MKIKLLRNPSSALGCELTEGESGEVSKELGDRLVDLGIAVEIERPVKVTGQAKQPEVTGVPEKPVKAKAKRS